MRARRRFTLPRRWPMLIPAAIGSLFLLLAAASAAPDMMFVLRAARTEGRFVGAVTRHGGNHGGTFYRPMFHYRTADGSIRTFTARGGSTSQPYADGDKAVILYDPANPADARLNGFLAMWIGPAVLGGCGLVLILLGLGLFGAIRRRDTGG